MLFNHFFITKIGFRKASPKDHRIVYTHTQKKELCTQPQHFVQIVADVITYCGPVRYVILVSYFVVGYLKPRMCM